MGAASWCFVVVRIDVRLTVKAFAVSGFYASDWVELGNLSSSASLSDLTAGESC